MRWEKLFRDLESQLEGAADAELTAEVADRTRREAAQLRLVDRLLPAVQLPVRLRVYGAGEVAVVLQNVSVDSLLIGGASSGPQALVPLDAILSVVGLTPRSAVPHGQGRVFERLRLTSALRGLARDRCHVRVVLRDGHEATGTIDRVGDDFFELAEHALGEMRRRDHVSGVRVVPLGALGAVLSY